MPLLPTYKSTQQNLYDLCKLAWNTVTTYLADFTAFSPVYVALFITGKLAAVQTAEDLPDEEQRIEDTRTTRVNMVNKAIAGCKAWQLLKRYIIKAYPKDQQEIKLNAAGQAHYLKASNEDWASVKRLLADGNAFITANSVALLAGSNMPPAFAASFALLQTDFETLYAAYLDLDQTDEVQTQTKIAANNAIHASVMEMFLDGQQIFKDDEAVKKLFTWEQVLLTVAGPGVAGIRGLVTDSATGNPLPEDKIATITIIGTDHTTTTNEEARYKIEAVAADTYIILATCPGYADKQITNVTIQTGTMKTLNIILTPLP